MARNVLSTPLEPCSVDPMTGFYRNGCCDTGRGDLGLHIVCAKMTTDFLEFSKSNGNDLTTPHPEFDFPGLKPGDRWCLCVFRWLEALEAGAAPPVYLNSTHVVALEHASLDDLKKHAID